MLSSHNYILSMNANDQDILIQTPLSRSWSPILKVKLHPLWMPSTNRTLASSTGWLLVLLPTSQRLSPTPLNVDDLDLKLIHENMLSTFRMSWRWLIVEKIDDALNGIIATLGFKVYSVLFLIVGSGLIVRAATILYFLDPLIMSLGVSVAFLPSYCGPLFWLLVANWSMESWNPSRVERRSASRFSC